MKLSKCAGGIVVADDPRAANAVRQQRTENRYTFGLLIVFHDQTQPFSARWDPDSDEDSFLVIVDARELML